MSEMNKDAQLWLLKQLYGIKTIPPTEDYETFIKLALICAKGDGVLAPEERKWIVGRAATFRNPGYELAKTYLADDDLLDVIGNSSTVDNNGRRMIIYVAIQACAADGDLNTDERAKVYKMAKSLGIEEDFVHQIEQLCSEEAKIREKRIALMFPEGVPY
ncbi:MAG: TerB family tellurite resistance protein [Nostochopsis sp.]